MDKPKILIATATRNPDGTFTIADDEEDILTKYPSAVYNELSGMESYGEPRTYIEEYAEESGIMTSLLYERVFDFLVENGVAE